MRDPPGALHDLAVELDLLRDALGSGVLRVPGDVAHASPHDLRWRLDVDALLDLHQYVGRGRHGFLPRLWRDGPRGSNIRRRAAVRHSPSWSAPTRPTVPARAGRFRAGAGL